MGVDLRMSLIVVGCLLPTALALLTSPEVRGFLRGTGSVRQTLSNAGVGALFLVSQVALRGVLFAFYGAVAAAVPWKLPTQNLLVWPLAFLAIEFIYYVQHRLEHRVPVLWAIHAVHHQSQDYNLSVSLRVGVLASLSGAIFHVPLALMGLSLSQYVLLTSVHAILLFTLHARTRAALGPGRFFNAPVFHRVHHASDAPYIDKNFGGVLLIFDRVFGTFTPLQGEPSYGVSGQATPPDPLRANLSPWLSLLERVRLCPTAGAKVRELFVPKAHPESS
jgi:alkylglycerol monooxygenase